MGNCPPFVGWGRAHVSDGTATGGEAEVSQLRARMEDIRKENEAYAVEKRALLVRLDNAANKRKGGDESADAVLETLTRQIETITYLMNQNVRNIANGNHAIAVHAQRQAKIKSEETTALVNTLLDRIDQDGSKKKSARYDRLTDADDAAARLDMHEDELQVEREDVEDKATPYEKAMALLAREGSLKEPVQDQEAEDESRLAALIRESDFPEVPKPAKKMKRSKKTEKPGVQSRPPSPAMRKASEPADPRDLLADT